jgi:HK97 family phage major capsid protein
MSETLTRDQIVRRATAETHKRSFTVERAEPSADDNRTVELAFASDTPCTHFSYKLFDFIDVKLSMESSAMRTERLTSGAALLADHDPLDQIGVVESFSIDPKEGKARAKVRFSRSTRGQEIYQDVVDGIRRNVSVGFSIHKLVLEEENEDGNDLYRADDWEPFELSIVSIPADISVGVGRSAEITKPNQLELKQMETVNTKPETPVETEPEVVTRKAADAKKVEDINNQIEFGKTFGFEKEVREAALANSEFTMDDARMLVQQLRDKQKKLEQRVSPIKPVDTNAATLGNALVTSNEYRNLRPEGPEGKQRRSIIVQTSVLPSDLQKRATYSGSGDSLTGYDRQDGVITLGQQQPTVADLFMQAQTDSPTIRYMREVSYTNAADAVLEGDEKPEASFDLEEVDATVRKVAVWSKVTDETLEDFSQIRPYIDSRLSFMVRSKIDDQLLNGTGTAPQIAGLLGTSGVQTAEMSSNTAVKLAEAIMNAITKVRVTGQFEPDAIVIHPNDYQKLRLATDGNTQYYGGGFFQGQYGTEYYDPGRLWGLRVVQTTAISEIDLATPAAGNKGPIVGNFKLGGAVFYRNGLSIEATNTNEDDFINNLTTIRVEQRLALAVYRPLAFCRVINAA